MDPLCYRYRAALASRSTSGFCGTFYRYPCVNIEKSFVTKNDAQECQTQLQFLAAI